MPRSRVDAPNSPEYPVERALFGPSMTVAKYSPPTHVHEVGPARAFPGASADEFLRLPPLLYCAGDVSLLARSPRVAVVGSRSASADGLRRAARLARLLAEAGAVVVSGLAKGIDRVAHEEAIARGGRTIAVIGTPLDVCYPAEHRDLQMKIYSEHLLVSQFIPGSRVFQSNFLARNHVMARIADVSVIADAGETSGSLSQARETMRLGRPLFLLRSLLDRPELSWPRQFVEKGARVLSTPDDLLGALNAAVVSPDVS